MRVDGARTYQILGIIVTAGLARAADGQAVEVIITTDSLCFDSGAVIKALYPNFDVFNPSKKEVK